jgi:hypothetical protein
MWRCELAGARRDLLDLDAGTLAIDVTRVVVDGGVVESDGKTENAQHLLALDPFTLAALKAHVQRLDQERRELGAGVPGSRRAVLLGGRQAEPGYHQSTCRRPLLCSRKGLRAW